jgi:hypothetical protein
MIYALLAPKSSVVSIVKISLATGLAIGLAFSAHAQIGVVGDTGIDASGNYQQERLWCQRNTSDAALINCLQNSVAAQAERRRGTLTSGNMMFEANALIRCEPFKGDDRAACRDRVLGKGTVSGSVMGGGLLKSVERTVPSDGGSVPSK